MLEKLFSLNKRGTTVKTEILAGLTTFITMAYILFLAPNILSIAGIPKDAVLIGTCLAAGITSILMGLIANYPIALAPGVGLLSFYSFTVVLGMGISWQTALGAVFISGIVFIILTATRIRQLIVEGIPASMKIAITTGIGLFITFIGLKLSGLVVINLSLAPDILAAAAAHGGNITPPASQTFLALGDLKNPETLLALFSLIFTALLVARKVGGALLIGVVVTSILAYATGVAHLPETLRFMAIPDFSQTAILQLDIPSAFHMGLITIIFSFTFVELFDTMGTLIGTATKAGIANPKTNEFPGLGKAMTVDAIGVSLGGMLGVSTVTAFIESASGVAAGGKTGLTAISTGVLFLIALLFAPILVLVPNCATAPVLVMVGAFMMGAVRDINFDDWTEGFPAFLVMTVMPFAYSIAEGISAGLVAYPLVKLIAGRGKEVSPIMYILFILVIIRYVWF